MGGRHTTHVANAYPSDVWVKCDAEREYVTAASYSFSRQIGFEGASLNTSHSANVRLDWHKVQTDFSRIPTGKYLKFDVDVGAGKDVVYISVFAADGKVIANGLQRYSDYSIIITKQGDIKDTEYGTLWTDTSGISHH